MNKPMMERSRWQGVFGLAASSAVLSAILLSGCSSTPDSANPEPWYKQVSSWVGGPTDRPPSVGDDVVPKATEFPSNTTTDRPAVRSTKDRSDLVQGLAADRANAKYAELSVNRDGAATRPLTGETLPSKPVSMLRQAPVEAEPLSPPAAPASATPPASPAPIAASRAPTTVVPTTVVPPVQVAEIAPPPAPAASAKPAPAPAPAPTPVAPPVAAATPAEPTVALPMAPRSNAPLPTMAPDDLPVPLAAMPANPPKPYGVKQAPAPAAAPTPAQPSMAEEAPAEEAKPAAPETVEQAYQRRLAEFARQDVPAAAVVAPVHRPRPAGSGATQVAQASDDTIHLVPPAEGRKITEGHHADGVRPLSQFPEGKSSNSFDVAALTFAEGTMELTGDDKARLKEVAKLAKDTHGSLRILGRSTSPRLDPNPGANQEANRQLARQRADAVARELVRLGVPASKVYAGPADSIDQLAATDATDIVLDY